jgi:EAL domain-containing protein (putative c-di-GMP-specific phosphodiesterase class I)/AmiR/NasT family two-component response regulator
MGTVLIAEDQPDVRSALALLISSEPSLRLVAEAADTDEAIVLAVEHRPDVALIDVKMPGGGGPRAVREIATRSPNTRLVALSAYEDRSSVFQMLRAGAVGYLVKGAPGEEIVGTIHSVLRGEGVLSSKVTPDVMRALAGHLEREETESASYRARLDVMRLVLEDRRVSTVFQPIVRLSTREVAGYEALSRIAVEPARRPDEWFDDAERVGLAVELEAAALSSALAQAGKLPSDAFLTVNVNPRELVTEAVIGILAAAPAGRLVVEVTEHAEVRDYEAFTEALTAFRGRGGRLAVDDFGSGRGANLWHILKLAPDLIKIDGRITGDLGTAPAARAMTACIAVFAKEMGMAVVAEHIESEHTIDVLESLGVEYGQGFHLGRPEALR